MAYPHDLLPQCEILFQPVGIRDYQLDKDPIVFPTVADDVNIKTSDSFDGRYRNSTGEIHGHAEPKRQNTYTTNARTGGRQFSVTGGAWFDDFQTDFTGVFGIVQQDNTKDISYTATSVDSTAGIENCTMFVGRGALPVVDASYQFNNSNTYLYIYLAWGQQVDFRIALEYRRPMRIDRTQDGWATAEKVAVARDCGDTERFFATNKHKLPIDVFVDRDNNQLVVELGDGRELTTTPYNPPDWQAGVDKHLLPTVGKIHLAGANGWCSFEYYPKRYKTLTAKIRKDPGIADHPLIGEAVVATNSRGAASATQAVTANVSRDGQIHTVDLTITQPDAGDGQGSTEPTKLVDCTLIVPAVFSTITGSDTSFYGRGMIVEYSQVWDDNTNTFYSYGNLILDNADGSYTGFQGNLAVDIWGTTGGSVEKIFHGIAGDGPGVDLFREDTYGRISCPIYDNSIKMRNPVGQRLILDRMCLYNAIHLICTLGGVHPSKLVNLPQYVPPGCSPDAPWGPAGDDCPYPVLANGSGSKARHDYGREMHGWDILQLIIQDHGIPNETGTASIPLYFGFDLEGYATIAAFDPSTDVPAVFFNQSDPSGFAQISGIKINYCTEQMRSSVDFVGLNPWSNALETYHVDQPQWVKVAIGYPKRWTEQNARRSGDYLVNSAKTAGAMSSIPQLTGMVHNSWIPGLNAGDRVFVYDENTLGFVLDCYIKQVDAIVGTADTRGQSGKVHCEATYSVRSTANTASLLQNF